MSHSIFYLEAHIFNFKQLNSIQSINLTLNVVKQTIEKTTQTITSN